MSGISPMRQGQTDPPAHLRFLDDTGKAIPFPNGTAFNFYIFDPNSGQTTLGQGTFSLVNEAQGMVDYNWHVNDTLHRSGKIRVFADYTLPTGGHGFGDEVEIIVKPLFVQQ